MVIWKMIQLISLACMLTAPSVSVADTIISGDLKLRDGGDVVFSDGSVQSKAQVQGPVGPVGPTGPAGGPPNTLTSFRPKSPCLNFCVVFRQVF